MMAYFSDPKGSTGLCAICLIAMLALMSTSAPASAHATGENYVWINAFDDHLEGRFEVRLADLRQKLGLALSSDYEEASKELLAQAPQIQDYLREHFEIRIDGALVPYRFTETKLLEARYFGHFAQFYYRTDSIAVPDRIEIHDALFFEGDRFHRSLLLVEYDARNDRKFGEEWTALVFSPANQTQTLDLSDMTGLLPRAQFVWQGMLHIWIGIDHILFLVALLIPAVLQRRDRQWQPVPRFRSVLWNTLKIVTVFTVAHSITLALAALEVIQLPSRLVESVIALSIILVALNNMFPRHREGTLLIIFFFGLFHGLGFASVMGQLPFRVQDLVWVVIAFNIGVEIGQVAIVAALVPVLYLLRDKSFYPRVVLQGGSGVLAAVAFWWFIERAFGIAG